MIARLYHGTCLAFVELARQRGRRFGPENNSVSFTPDYGHARIFAEGWMTPAGRKILKKYFGDLPTEYTQPVILEFNPEKLGQLNQRDDCGHAEFFIEKGPVNLDAISERRL